MSEQYYQAMRTRVLSLAPLPDSEWIELTKNLRITKLAVGESLVHFRGPADRVGFVVKGLLKAYYLTGQGDEFIRAFIPENSFAAALSAIYQGERTPSEVGLTAIEPTEMVTLDYGYVRSRLPVHWTWQQICRIIAERYYIHRERRHYELLTMPANDRLKSFMALYPGLANRISQADLAAYLGITPASLSRMRGRQKSDRAAK